MFDLCIGEPPSQKKATKQNAATKILEMLSTRYIFLEEIEEKYLIPESKIFKISDKNVKELYKNGPTLVKGVSKKEI